MHNKFVFRFFVIALSLSILIGCSPGNKPEPDSIQPSMILFGSTRDGSVRYYLMDPNGGNVKLIDQGKFPYNTSLDRPIWSIEAKKYFFSASQNNTADLYSINSDGSGLVNLTNTPGIYEGSLTLSPDSKHLSYVGLEIDTNVYISDLDGKNRVDVSQYSGQNGLIQWAPDSSKIFYSSNRGGTPNIFAVNTDGSNRVNISKGKGLDGKYSLSPDGKQLVFDSDRDGAVDIFVVDANGGTPANITKNPARDVEPIWSPDGKRIAFRSDRDGGWNLFVMNLDGSGAVNLTAKYNLNAGNISWTPDSQRLLLDAQVDNQSEIFLLPVDGTPPVNLTNNPADDIAPVWMNFK
jgi:Tol biopolymer transport system component